MKIYGTRMQECGQLILNKSVAESPNDQSLVVTCEKPAILFRATRTNNSMCGDIHFGW